MFISVRENAAFDEAAPAVICSAVFFLFLNYYHQNAVVANKY